MAYRPNSTDPNQPTMAELLALENERPELRKGDVVEGEVMGSSAEGLLISVGGYKSEGIVPYSELRSIGILDPTLQYKNGDTIEVLVLETRTNRNGHITLSHDQAVAIDAWANIEQSYAKGTAITGIVTEHNRGGIVVNVRGLQEFIPLSHVVLENGIDRETALANKHGTTISMKPIEINRKKDKVVFSERNAFLEQKNVLKNQLIDKLRIGDRCEGKVTGLSKFGAFVDIGGIDGLVHLTEISWGTVSNVSEHVSVGQVVNVEIINIDPDSKRIGLSMRKLIPAPWDEVPLLYKIGQLVQGQIMKLSEFGAFAKISEGVEGLIHISELAEKHINHPKDIVSIGDTLSLRIISLDPDRRRIGLSLKQAIEEEDWPTEYFDPVD